MVIERMLHSSGLPLYISDPEKPTKMKLNEGALSQAQLSTAENEAFHLSSKRLINPAAGPKFERTFSLESVFKDAYNSDFDEQNYKNFRRAIISEERREFAAKVYELY